MIAAGLDTCSRSDLGKQFDKLIGGMETVEYADGMVEYARSLDVPLVTIIVDRRHCTGAQKGVVTAQGPAPDEFTTKVLELVEKFPERFEKEQV
jgi:hypothetical protein